MDIFVENADFIEKYSIDRVFFVCKLLKVDLLSISLYNIENMF